MYDYECYDCSEEFKSKFPEEVFMAHTCGSCGCPIKVIVAPTENGAEILDNKFKTARNINTNYHHDVKSWKSNSKAAKQWAKHF